MRRIAWQAAALIVVLAIWFALKSAMPDASDTVQYQGESIQLSKAYDDYDDYKNDPNNIAPADVEKAQRLVNGAPIARKFPDRNQMIDAVFKLNFPGFALSTFGDQPQADGTVLAMHAIEIPRSGGSRYLVYRGSGGAYELFDDFVHADAGKIETVSSSGAKLIYATKDGSKIIEREPAVK